MADIEQRISIIPEGFKETAQQAEQLRAKFAAFFKEVERSSQSRAGANNLLRQMEDSRKAIRGAAEEAGKLKRELGNATTLGLLTKTQDGAKDALVDVKRLNESVRDLRNELNSLPEGSIDAPRINPRGGGGAASIGRDEQRRRDLFEASDPVGDVDTAVSAFAGAAGQFGGAGVEQAARGISDVLAISEAAPRLVGSLATISPAMLATTGALGAGAIAFYALNKALDASAESAQKDIDAIEQRLSAEQQSREDLRSLSAAEAQQRIEDLQADIQATRQARTELDQLRDAARADDDRGIATSFTEIKDRALEDIADLGERFGVNLGALGELNKALDEQNKNLTEQKTELERILEVERELRNIELGRTDADVFIEGLNAAGQQMAQTSEDVQSLSSEAVQEQIAEAELRKSIAQQNLEAAQAQSEFVRTLWGSATGDEATRIENELIGLKQASEDYAEAIADEDAEIQRLTTDVAPLVARREQEAQLIERVNQLSEQRNQILEDQARIDDQIADLESDRERELAIRAEDEALKALHQSELDAIDARIKEAQAIDAQRAQQEKIVSLQNERVQRQGEIDARFFNDTLKLVTEAREEETRITRDEGLKRLRFLQDLESDLFELAAERDTSGFLSRLRRGTTDLSRSDEDSDIAAGDRRDALRASLDEAAAARDEELAQLEQHYDQRLEAESRGQRKIISLVEQLQQEREAIRARQQAEVELVRQQREAQAHQDRIAALNQQREELQTQLTALDRQLIQNVGTLAFNFGAAGMNGLAQGAIQQIQSFLPQIQAMLTSFLPGFVRPQQTVSPLARQASQNSRYITQNAGGGIYPGSEGPKLIQVGEDPSSVDAVFAFKKSEGYDRAVQRVFGGGRGGGTGSGQGTYVDLRGATFGPDITRDDLQRFGEQLAGEIGQGFRAGIGLVA